MDIPLRYISDLSDTEPLYSSGREGWPFSGRGHAPDFRRGRRHPGQSGTVPATGMASAAYAAPTTRRVAGAGHYSAAPNARAALCSATGPNSAPTPNKHPTTAIAGTPIPAPTTRPGARVIWPDTFATPLTAALVRLGSPT